TYDLYTSTSGSKTHDLCTSTTGSRTYDLYHQQQDRQSLHLHHRWQVDLHLLHLSQVLHIDDEMSHHEGEGSYSETMRRNHRFTEHSDELRARSTWTTTARANFKHLLYNVRRNVERVCASIDKNQWKEHGTVWMRKEYWMELCVIWGGEKCNENSVKAKLNRVVHPEVNVHTSGSISFATHKVRLVSTLIYS
ncbi:hypothetical protein Taro_002741, partial [Colocasia esculenta]|nr:hypothetical protein [Colocasia esculenta]